MKINKKEIKNILIIISVIAILLIVAIGISYAYFTLNTVGTSKLDVTVETEKIPDLTFSSDNDLMLVADSSNFFIGNGDVSAETKPYALFEYNGEYTLEYSVYLNINSDFVYTTADKSPELILVIKDENGDYITSIDNLEFINYSENIKGFDVTESKGSFKIFENKEISTSSNQTSTKHEYTFELYFINLDTPQNENIDKTFNGEVIFRKSESKLNEHIMSLSNLNQGEGKLVHETYESDTSSLANNGIVDTGYRYQGKNPNNYLFFNGEKWRIIGVFETETADGNIEYLTKIIIDDPLDNRGSWDHNELNNWPTSDAYNLLNGAYLNSYDGSNGSTSEEQGDYCYLEHYKFAICDYQETGIKNISRNYIENVVWKLGAGTPDDDSDNASNFYEMERSEVAYEGNYFETSGYVGLMYPSDFGYGVLADNCSRTSGLYYPGGGYYNYQDKTPESCTTENWLYNGKNRWFLTSNASENKGVWALSDYGRTNLTNSSLNSYTLDPVVYLKSDVLYLGGEGSKVDPIVVSYMN